MQWWVWRASMGSCEPDGWHLPTLLKKDPELRQQKESSGLHALPWNINFLFRYQRQGDTTQIISMPLQIFMCTTCCSLVNGMPHLRDWIGRNTCLPPALVHCIIHFTSLVFALLWLHSCSCTSQLNRARAWIWALDCGLPMVLHARLGTTLSGNNQEQPGGQQRDNLDVTTSLWCKRSAVRTSAWPYQLGARPKNQTLACFTPRWSVYWYSLQG